MPVAIRLACFALLCGSLPALAHAQAPAAGSEETNRAVAGGGITVPGWQGQIDASAQKQGQTVKDAKLAPEGSGMRVTTGPAISYWNPTNKATGDYTVSATFNEPKFMNLNTHPHPYGVFIGGSDLGTPQASMLYCAAYGNGKFIVRGFGPDAFQMNGRGEANDAVHKAAGPGEPVMQTIALSVKGDKVSCSINGTVVGTYDKSAVTGTGKLKSTDGIYGIRFAHNTDAIVTDLKVTKP
jgi:hypothetical protein